MEINLDLIDTSREIESAVFTIYRNKYTDSCGYGATEQWSSVRELHRTDFSNMKESYFDMYYPYYWPDYGTLIDTFDAEDNFTPGYEHFNITDVVKDSLKSVNKRIRMVLKVRDETKSYNRMVNYKSDWDNTVQTDTVGQHDTTIAQWPKLTIVYKDPVSVIKENEIRTNSHLKCIEIFNMAGKKLGRYKVDNRKLVEKFVNMNPNGFYFVRFYTENNYYSEKMRVLK